MDNKRINVGFSNVTFSFVIIMVAINYPFQLLPLLSSLNPLRRQEQQPDRPLFRLALVYLHRHDLICQQLAVR